jgi:phage shock protein PspC (stress-responsive transcriptional regulator)
MLLRRTTKDRYLGGVLGGLARAWSISPVILRVIAVLLLLNFRLIIPVLFIYFLCWVFLPEDDDAVQILPPMRASKPLFGDIRRSRHSRMLAGVCGGIADYYRIDVNYIRIGVAAVTILTLGWGSLLYGLATLLIPQEGM